MEGDFAMLSAGVPLVLAEHRAQTISDLEYELALSIPASRDESISGRLVARFELASVKQALVFDFAQPAESVLGVEVGGQATAFEARNEHIVIPVDSLSVGPTEVAIEFVAGDSSLNRRDDFLYTLFVPDRARTSIPVFDQPDLKATCELHLEVPASWEAVANGPLVGEEEARGRRRLHFRLREPVPTYLLAFAAGSFEVVEREREGRVMRLLHRETSEQNVERNLDAIFDLHFDALSWLEEYTGIDHPFEKFDFVAVPAFQYGGMEHTGAILYRARSLFLDESATQAEYLSRASLIAHETAHMWFGNLVTMRWFDDVWMKEVMANFMAAKIVHPSFPEVDHELRFLLAHYPAAYEVDRTAGANPIRQPLENLDEAGSLYGAIIYQKAPIVMRQLEMLLGEESFRAGIREYLEAHSYGNATWNDLIEIVDARTDRDLRSWSQVWVEEPGRPRIVTELEVAAAKIEALRIRQEDPSNSGRTWSQPLQLLLGYDGASDRRIEVDFQASSLEISEATGLPVPDFVLVNGDGVGYGEFVLDPRSREYLLEHLPQLESSMIRAVGWLTLWDALLDGQIPPQRLIDLALRLLANEPDELNIQRMVADLGAAYWRYLDAEQRQELAPSIEALLWQSLDEAPTTRRKAAYFSGLRNVASTPETLARLRELWAEEESIEGLPLSENDMIALAQGLAVRGVPDAEKVLDAQYERIANPDRRARFEFVRPALSADQSVRDAFFETLKDPAQRRQERWVLEALDLLHHPLRAEASRHLIRPGLDLLQDVQRTGDIFFPLGWLQATLRGHQSPEAAAIVDEYLAENPELPPRLRGKLLQAADPLQRAARILSSGK